MQPLPIALDPGLDRRGCALRARPGAHVGRWHGTSPFPQKGVGPDAGGIDPRAIVPARKYGARAARHHGRTCGVLHLHRGFHAPAPVCPKGGARLDHLQAGIKPQSECAIMGRGGCWNLYARSPLFGRTHGDHAATPLPGTKPGLFTAPPMTIARSLHSAMAQCNEPSRSMQIVSVSACNSRMRAVSQSSSSSVIL